MRASSTPELLAGQIREAIAAGEFAPGSQLHQENLAERFGVSRSPIREALRLLEARGLITYQSNRGAVVSTLSVADIDEMFEIRRLLEVQLVRHTVAAVDDATVERARRLLDSLKGEPDPHEWLRGHTEFHQTLYRAARRPRMLEAALQQAVPVSDSPYAVPAVGAARSSFERHDRELLRALKARDEAAAVQSTCDHLEAARAKLLSLIPEVTR